MSFENRPCTTEAGCPIFAMEFKDSDPAWPQRRNAYLAHCAQLADTMKNVDPETKYIDGRTLSKCPMVAEPQLKVLENQNA